MDAVLKDAVTRIVLQNVHPPSDPGTLPRAMLQ